MRRVLPWMLLLLSAFAARAQDQSPVKQEQDLADLRVEIDHARRRSDALASDEEQQLARIHAIEREAALTHKLISQLATKELGIRTQIDTLQFEMDSLHGRIDQRRDRLSTRLRTMYMRPRTSVVATVLSARNMTELGSRLRAMTHLARMERSLIGGVQEAQGDLRHRRGRLAGQMAEINLTRSEVEDRRIELESLQGKRGEALAEVRAERARFDASLKEMEGAARQMQDLITRLQSERDPDAQATTNFGQRAGSLLRPVAGPILKPFGRSVHPEFGTVVMNKGVNIGAPMGTPIRCIAEGTVEFVDWLPGYGKCIIVDHGDGYYSLYAHASSIFPARGAVVRAGDVLGEVGDTGSLNGTQLYFEIRKGKDSLNPGSWLSPGQG